MELDLEQTVEQLRSMFPSFDDGSIKAVLASNGGL